MKKYRKDWLDKYAEYLAKRTLYASEGLNISSLIVVGALSYCDRVVFYLLNKISDPKWMKKYGKNPYDQALKELKYKD